MSLQQRITALAQAIGADIKMLRESSPMAVPAYKASGSQLRLALTSNQSLPVINASGTTLNISVITNG